MLQQVSDLKTELNFDNLYNYLYQIYLNGEYRDIKIEFTDFEGTKCITIKSPSFMSFEKVSIYEVMSKDTPQEEHNCIRYFNEDGVYEDSFDLKDILSFFNRYYKSNLRSEHIVEYELTDK